MTSHGLAVALLAALVNPQAPRGRDVSAPPVARPGVALTISGKVPKTLELDAEAFGRLPRKKVRAMDHDGKEAEYEGVALVDLLGAAGLNLTPDELRGNALEHYLVVEASDGYRAVFALPELSPAFTDRVVLLADRRDGGPIGGDEGPLRVVVPGEKRHARWVRQVVGLRVGSDRR